MTAAVYSGGLGAVLVPVVVVLGVALYLLLIGEGERPTASDESAAVWVCPVCEVCPVCGGAFIDHGDWVECDTCDWSNAWW